MTNFVNRNPQGRENGAEGIVDAVKDKSAEELLAEILTELRRLRLALVLNERAADVGDTDLLSQELP